MGADALGGSCHAFRTEIGAVGEHAGQHGGYILRRISRPDMGELVGKSRPFMHFPQQIGNFDQGVHFGDFGIEGFCRGRNVARPRRHDQGSVFHPHPLKLSIAGTPGQPLQVEVHHLPDFRQPCRTVALDSETELAFLLQGNEGQLRYQMFVDRAERAATLDPHIPGVQPVTQMRECCNLVKPPIRLSIFEDQLPLRLCQMPDRNAIGQRTPSLRVELLQGGDRGKQRIVSPPRVEGECLEKRAGIFADGCVLLGRHHQRRHITVLYHGLKTGFDLKQSMPPNTPIQCGHRICIRVVGRLQGHDRVEEQSQCL